MQEGCMGEREQYEYGKPPSFYVPSGHVIKPCKIMAEVICANHFMQWTGYPPKPKKGDWVVLLECVGPPEARTLDSSSFRVSGGTWGSQQYGELPAAYRLIVDLETGERL